MAENILTVMTPQTSGVGFSSIFILIMFIILVITAIHLFYKSQESFKLGIQIPGPEPIPILGNALMALGKSPNEIVEECLRLGEIYGHVARGFLGYNVVVFLTDPRDVELILNSNVHLTKSSEYRFFKPWLGDGLLISSGEKWRSHRKLIAPTFHQLVLKSFVGAFNRNSWRLVERLQSECGHEFDVHDYMSEVTVDILLETAMGHPKTHDDHEGYEYAMAVMKLCDIIHRRHSTFYLRPDIIFNLLGIKKQHDTLVNTIHSLTTKVLKNKSAQMKKSFESGQMQKTTYSDLMNQTTDSTTVIRDDTEEDPLIGEKNRLAFLDLMLESTYCGADISEIEIKEEVDTIMFEGHDTTAAGSSFVLCLMACHQDIQQKVYEEQKQIFGDSKRSATFADTLQMNYLERVIMETLRLYPPVPVIAREVKENVKLASKPYTIPAGSTVVIGTFKIHRRKDIYENPDKFNPDNFLPERTQNRNYYGFIPFSAGPRSCVGRKYAILKLKILLSTILRSFKIYSSCTEADFKLQADIILKRTDGFRIRVEPR
ncbi:cytochrome P450 4g15-like [Contarinia nasturtii]|uniref:cytochrome P450 4g15-like n=1 Tax=Contarinia nasturtii TaxID=265458 RepID=UPI0012D494FD|nr:cytochrome P450 4g15-like [Contarinia nasturtii]